MTTSSTENVLPQRGFVTANSLATALCCSVETIKDWILRYDIPALSAPGNMVVLLAEDFWNGLPSYDPKRKSATDTTDSGPIKPDSERTGESGERDRRRTAVTVRQDRGESAGTVGTSRRRKLTSDRATTESRIGN